MALGRTDEDGRIGVSKIVPIDTKRWRKIAELCWLSVPLGDDRFQVRYGFLDMRNISSFHIHDGLEIKSRADPAP